MIKVVVSLVQTFIVNSNDGGDGIGSYIVEVVVVVVI